MGTRERKAVTMNATPQSNEQHASHIPALATLINLGWTFMPATECMALRVSQREAVMKPVLERVCHGQPPHRLGA